MLKYIARIYNASKLKFQPPTLGALSSSLL